MSTREDPLDSGALDWIWDGSLAERGFTAALDHLDRQHVSRRLSQE